MPKTTDLIPGTNASYDATWAKTSERVYTLWQLLTTDTIPAPTVSKDGVPLTPEELDANPTWYLKSYLKESLEAIYELRKEVRDATRAEVVRDATLASAVRAELLAAVPALADAVASELEGVPADQIRSAVELGVRNVLGSLKPTA